MRTDICNKILFFSLLINVFFLLAALLDLKIYLRTKLKCYLFFVWAEFIALVGFLGISTSLIMNIELFRNEDADPIFFSLIGILLFAGIIHFFGKARLLTTDRELWIEISKNTTFWQRVLGNFPAIKANDTNTKPE